MTELHTIDLHFQDTPHTIAAYLLLGDHRPVLVETGPATTRQTLVAGLRDHGVKPADVGHVFVTHIHLDHAGDAGWWAAQGATLYVHPVGAPHLIDPAKLLRSANRIYGADMDRLWGTVTPAPAERVVTLVDGQIVKLGDLAVQALDTPGHASHHFVYLVDDIAFTGDAAGIRTPTCDVVDLPAPPPEFDREAWLATLNRLRALELSAIYPTHFGCVEAVARQFDQLTSLIISASGLIRALLDAGLERDEMVSAYHTWVRERFDPYGVPKEIINQYAVANPLFMSVDGMARYWRKRTAAG